MVVIQWIIIQDDKNRYKHVLKQIDVLNLDVNPSILFFRSLQALQIERITQAIDVDLILLDQVVSGAELNNCGYFPCPILLFSVFIGLPLDALRCFSQVKKRQYSHIVFAYAKERLVYLRRLHQLDVSRRPLRLLFSDAQGEFLRVHHSYLVNPWHIVAVKADYVVMSGDFEVPLGKTYRDTILKQLKVLRGNV